MGQFFSRWFANTSLVGEQGTASIFLTGIAIYSFAGIVLITEIFSNHVRPTAISLAVGALWVASFVLHGEHLSALRSRLPAGLGDGVLVCARDERTIPGADRRIGGLGEA
jgi:hypothetical protein